MTNNRTSLSENELISLIKETIKEVLREEMPKILLTEMAMSLSEYKKRVENLIQQILENWCLIRYSTITGDKTELKNHWKIELLAHINNIASLKLKNGNSLDTKINTLFSLWNKYDLDTDESAVSQRIFAKFKKEQIPTNTKEYAMVVDDFKKNIKKITYALTDTSPESVLNYIENI